MKETDRLVSNLFSLSLVQVSETEMNGQFESVCESVFSEVESQAMEALDLPGCFRTRSHSYLRAIQAGYSQDDDCVPSMTSSTVTSTIRSTAGELPGSPTWMSGSSGLCLAMEQRFSFLIIIKELKSSIPLSPLLKLGDHDVLHVQQHDKDP